MSPCPDQCSFQRFGLSALTENPQAVYLDQRLTIRRLHMKVRRGMVIGIDFDFPIAVILNGSHRRKLEKFFPQIKSALYQQVTFKKNPGRKKPHTGLRGFFASNATLTLQFFTLPELTRYPAPTTPPQSCCPALFY